MALARLDGPKATQLVRKELATCQDRYPLIEAAGRGIEMAVQRYQRGEYFLADLIMAAEIFRELLDLVLEEQPEPKRETSPVIIGTVRNDIHDIGKNIVIGLMRCRGLDVRDLGVDVWPGTFIEAVAGFSSSVLCLSGLITPAYESMKQTITLLENQGLRDRTTVILGGMVDKTICEFVGADYHATDISTGIDLCARISRNWSAERAESKQLWEVI
jgi:methanogenic corrinoid protein MtbC1